MMNKMDPTVDSDLDGRNRHGTSAGGFGSSTGSHHTPGMGSTTGSHITPGSTTGGYGSNNSGAMGGATGYDAPGSTNAGHHSSNMGKSAEILLY